MKKIFAVMMSLMAAVAASAQTEIQVPEYVGQVAVINADSTTTLLERETADIKVTSSKFGYIPIPGSSLLDKAKTNLVVKGKSSKTVLKGDTLTFIYRAEKNNIDPKEAFGIIKFEEKKKERRYVMAEAGLLSGAKAMTSFNSIPSEAKKYGDECYIISVSNCEPGEYGFITTDMSKVSTFSVIAEDEEK